MDSLFNIKREPYKYTPASMKGKLKITNLKIIDKTKNIGKVKRGDNISRQFRITNIGDNKLHLFDIKPDCDCASYSIDKNGINPLDTLTITIEVDTKDKLGRSRSNTIFQANTNDKIYKVGVIYEVVE